MPSQNEMVVTARAVDRMSGPLGTMRNNARGVMGDIERTFLRLAAITAGTAIFGGVATAAVTFESAFAGVRKTVDATEAQFKQLSDGIRNMAKELPASANSIAKVAEVAGQLGVGVQDIEKFTRVMVDLGETTVLSSDEAALSIARFANVAQTSLSDVDRLGSVLVDLGNNFPALENEILSFGTRLVGAGEIIGLTEAQILGLGAALASTGVRVESGGTAISRVMIAMSQEVANGGEKLQQFAEIAGMTADQFVNMFRSDPAEALVRFIEGLKNAADAGANVFDILEDVEFQNIRIRDALLLTANAGDTLRDAMRTGSQAWQENTALTEEAARRYETTASQLRILKNNLIDVAISMGNAALPAVREFSTVAASLTTHLSVLSPIVKAAAVAVGVFIAALAVNKVVQFVSAMTSFQAVFVAGKGGGLMAGIGSATLGLTHFNIAVLAVTASVIALDQITKATSGEGLLAFFEKAESAADNAKKKLDEAAKAAAEPWKQVTDEFTILSNDFDKFVADFNSGNAELMAAAHANETVQTEANRNIGSSYKNVGTEVEGSFLALIENVRTTGRNLDDLREMWDRLPESIQNNIFSSTEYKKLIEALAPSLDNTTSRVAAFDADLATLGGTLGSVASDIGQVANELEKFGNGLNDAVNLAGAFAERFIETDTAFIETRQTLQQYQRALAELDAVQSDFHQGLGMTREQLENQIESLEANVSLFELLEDEIRAAATSIAALAGPDAVGQLVAELDRLGISGEDAVNSFQLLEDALIDFKNGGIEVAAEALSDFRNSLGDQQAWDSILKVIADAFDVLPEVITNAIDRAEIGSMFYNLGLNAAAQVANGIVAGGGDIYNAVLFTVLDAINAGQNLDLGALSGGEEDKGPGVPIRFGGEGSADDPFGIQDMFDTIKEEIDRQAGEPFWGEKGYAIIDAVREGGLEAASKAAASWLEALEGAWTSGEIAGIGEQLAELLKNAFEQGFSEESLKPIEDFIKRIHDEVTVGFDVAGKSAADIFNEVFQTRLADFDMADRLGKLGVQAMDALREGIASGSVVAIADAAGFAANVINKLEETLSPEEAHRIGNQLTSAMAEALNEGTPEALAAVENLFALIQVVIEGGLVDFQAGVAIMKEDIEELADFMGVSAADIIENLDAIVVRGLVEMLDKLKGLPDSARKTVDELVRILTEGQGKVQAWADGVAELIASVAPATGGPASGSDSSLIQDLLKMPAYAREAHLRFLGYTDEQIKNILQALSEAAKAGSGSGGADTPTGAKGTTEDGTSIPSAFIQDYPHGTSGSQGTAGNITVAELGDNLKRVIAKLVDSTDALMNFTDATTEFYEGTFTKFDDLTAAVRSLKLEPTINVYVGGDLVPSNTEIV